MLIISVLCNFFNLKCNFAKLIAFLKLSKILIIKD